MTQHTNTRLEAVDVITGERDSIGDSRRVGTRSRSQDKKTKLFNYILFGKEALTSLTDNVSYQEEFLQLCLEFAFGTRQDVEYMANVIVGARQNGFDKNLPITALVILSISDREYAKEKFRSIFDKVILSSGDLSIMLTIIKTKIFRGFGKTIQKAIGRFINRMSPLDLLECYAIQTSFKLKDIIKYCHIKPLNPIQAAIFTFVIKQVVTTKLPKVFVAYNKLRAETNWDEKCKLVESNNFSIKTMRTAFEGSHLPIHKAFDRVEFSDVFKYTDYLVNNINDEQYLRLKEILGSKKLILNSKITPFHFVRKYDSTNITDRRKDNEIKRLLEKCIETSYDNILKSDKKVVIILDQNAEGKGTSNVVPTVSDFAVMNSMGAILAKASTNSILIPFCDKAKAFDFDKTERTLDIAERLTSASIGQSSLYDKPFSQLPKLGKVDSIICISPNVSWINALRATQAGDILSRYLNEYDPEHTTKMIFWSFPTENIQSHSLPNTVFVNGSSFNLINFVTNYSLTGIDTH